MKSIYIPIALLLLGVGLMLNPGNPITFPDSWNPLNWLVRGPATVCIIEETKDRTSYDKGQIAVMQSTTFPKEIAASGGTFLGCFDKEIVDRNKVTPPDLVPYLSQASFKVVKYPALVWKRGNKYTAIELPNDEKTALEKLK